MALTSSLHREEYMKRRRTTLILRVTLSILLIGGLIGFTSYLAHLRALRISSVELTGGILVTEDEVSAETLSALSGSYLFLYPKNNSLLYPHDTLEQRLKDHFKRIDTITISLKNFHTLSVVITERKPVALWCGTAEDITTSTHCYFMDDTSTLFADAPYFSGDAYFKYYGPLATTSSPDIVLGSEYIASSTIFRDISAFVSTTRDLHLRPQYLLAQDNGEFTLVIAGGGNIYFDTEEPLSKVTENLKALLRTPTLAPSELKNLPIDYIDLRFGNKLYYKLK